MADSSSVRPSPLILLKTPSPTPEKDPYTLALSPAFQTHYVPVLSHTLLPDPLIQLLLTHLSPNPPNRTPDPINPSPQNVPEVPPVPKKFPYGALLLTSQRAVAALSTAISSPPLQTEHIKSELRNLPLILYTVGPATANAVKDIIREHKLEKGWKVYGGKDAGSGEVLAGIILNGIEGQNEAGKYKVPDNNATDPDPSPPLPSSSSSSSSIDDNTKTPPAERKKPVLFLTGEKRRDILPATLMSRSLPPEERIQVDEQLIYKTTELDTFSFSFSRVLALTETNPDPDPSPSNPTFPSPNPTPIRWIIVFSPTAGKVLFDSLGWLDPSTGKVRTEISERKGRRRRGRTFVCCIGPTTKAYLEREFGFVADVVAGTPSAEGVREGVVGFMRWGMGEG